MKSTDVFPSKSLKAADLGTNEPVVVIESVALQTFDDNTTKPIITFRGKEKMLVCNKTNWNAICEITGETDSDNWTGHRVKLVVTKVDFQGKRVDAIRVEAPPKAQRQAAAPPPPLPPAREPGDEAPLTDDDIPFAWLLPLVLPAVSALGVLLA